MSLSTLDTIRQLSKEGPRHHQYHPRGGGKQIQTALHRAAHRLYRLQAVEAHHRGQRPPSNGQHPAHHQQEVTASLQNAKGQHYRLCQQLRAKVPEDTPRRSSRPVLRQESSQRNLTDHDFDHKSQYYDSSQKHRQNQQISMRTLWPELCKWSRHGKSHKEET